MLDTQHSFSYYRRALILLLSGSNETFKQIIQSLCVVIWICYMMIAFTFLGQCPYHLHAWTGEKMELPCTTMSWWVLLQCIFTHTQTRTRAQMHVIQPGDTERYMQNLSAAEMMQTVSMACPDSPEK